MKAGVFFTAAATVIVGVFGLSTQVAEASGSRSCGGIDIQSCQGDHRINVTGTSRGNDSNDLEAPSGPAPVGSIQLVACGPNTRAQLVALGDSLATTDSADCNQRIANCLQNLPKRLTGASIRVQKQADGSWTLNGSVCTAPVPPQVTAPMVRAQAVRLIPTAALGLAPHDTTLVNIQTVMWVDAPRKQTLRPVTILGQRVLIRLTIDHVNWRFGDNVSRTSQGAGKPYNQSTDPCRTAQCPGYYGHTYRIPGTHRITATASWRASFTVNGGAATDIPGTIPGPGAATTVTVKQARAVLTPNPAGH